MTMHDPGGWDPETQALIDQHVEAETARLVQEARDAEAAREPATLREMLTKSRGAADKRRAQMTDQILRRNR